MFWNDREHSMSLYSMMRLHMPERESSWHQTVQTVCALVTVVVTVAISQGDKFEWLRSRVPWLGYSLLILPAILVLPLGLSAVRWLLAGRRAYVAQRQAAELRSRSAAVLAQVVGMARTRLVSGASSDPTIGTLAYQLPNKMLKLAGPLAADAIRYRDRIWDLGQLVRELDMRDLDGTASSANLTARVLEKCVVRIVELLREYIEKAATEESLDECEMLRNLLNEFVRDYDGAARQMKEIGADTRSLEPLGDARKMLGRIKPRP
jgi:hypothetical protein